MFLKVTAFHWQGLAGPALAIAGLALLIAAGSLYLFFRDGQGRADTKRVGVFGGLLIGVGLAAFAVFGGGQVSSEKYEFIAPAKTEVGRIYYQPLTERLNIPLSQMICVYGARVLKDPERIEINRNVYVETPFVFIGDGPWALELSASGTEAEGEKARIIVGVLSIGETGTSLSAPFSIYDLGTEAKTFQIPIRLAAGKIAAVRIECLNALNLSKKPIRVVTISNVAFRKQ